MSRTSKVIKLWAQFLAFFGFKKNRWTPPPVKQVEGETTEDILRKFREGNS